MKTTATIIICTYNRYHSLIDTLDSITKMIVSADISWEILVVDNNSSDQTRQRVESFIKNGKYTNIKYLFEEKQGKAHALNQAVTAAQGELLAFTDDDAIIDRNWLQRIVTTFREYDADCVGGKVVPLWLVQRPVWLTDNLLNVLAMLDYGDQAYAIDKQSEQILYGVNYAFKKTFFADHGLFNTDLCSRGAGNEDHEIFDRLRSVNGRAIYHPDIIVQHKVFPERATKAYFRRWHKLVGKDRASIVGNTRLRLFGIEAYMIRNFTKFVTAFCGSFLRADGNAIFYNELKIRLYLSFFKTRIGQFLQGHKPGRQPNRPLSISQ